MGKSLTEVAKAVLMKESNDSAPDAGAKSMNPNMATLRPGSRLMEPNPMNNTAQDLGPALVNNTDVPPSAKASGVSKKDTSASSQSRKGTMPAEKMMAEEEEEIEEGVESMPSMPEDQPKKSHNATIKSSNQDRQMEEEIEISEELEAFIDQCLEEGLSEEEIAEAIDENFEILEEDIELDEAKKLTNKEYRAAYHGMSDNEKEFHKAMGVTKNMSSDHPKYVQSKEKFNKIRKLPDDAVMGDAINILREDYDDLEEDIDYEYTVDMSEHVAALFEGEDLSEEFKQKAIAIFEAAVTSTVKSELAAIEEAYAATLEEEVDELKEELSSNVDDYLNYVVENWVSENEVAIEAGLRTELTEEFISGLRSLFAENYIDIPEDKISVVEELGDKVAELENKLNEEIERNVELNAILSESKKTEVMYAMTEGLTTTQAEKLKSLAENVEFKSEQEYAHKVATLRESYFPSSITSHSQLDYIEPGSDGRSMISESLEGPMSRYVEVLGKKLPN